MPLNFPAGHPLPVTFLEFCGGYGSCWLVNDLGFWDIDFGAGTGPSAKTGLAATGQAANDFWNYYTRDDGAGGWLTFGAVPNLKLADGIVTSVGIEVANAAGYWEYFSTDPMYFGYIYPNPSYGQNATVTVTNLPVGRYDLYAYGLDSTFQVSAGGVSYGTKTSYDIPMVNPPVWQEGKQYALFKNVAVSSAGQSVISPGGGWVPFTMRVDADPFTDPSVRQFGAAA